MRKKQDRQYERPLEGRWLVVSADDDGWERVRDDSDFVLDFEAAGRFRVVIKPKSERVKALFGDRPLELEESYRIEDGLFVQSSGGLHLVSKYSLPKKDELEFERIRIYGCGAIDGNELNDCKVVLRRIHE